MLRRLWQRHPTPVILGLLAILSSPIWGAMAHGFYVHFFVWTDEDRAHPGEEGLPSEARRWRAVLDSIPDLNTAERDHPELVGSSEFTQKRFKTGEWVLGIATKSHTLSPWGKGGTVVLKDSRGQIRVFYGHVCGSPLGGGLGYAADYGKTLDEFYDGLKTDGYTEQFLTP